MKTWNCNLISIFIFPIKIYGKLLHIPFWDVWVALETYSLRIFRQFFTQHRTLAWRRLNDGIFVPPLSSFLRHAIGEYIYDMSLELETKIYVLANIRSGISNWRMFEIMIVKNAFVQQEFLLGWGWLMQRDYPFFNKQLLHA